MGLRTLLITGFLAFFCAGSFAQDYFSYGGGNFSGLQQVIANPANAADNRLKLDIVLLGFDATFNNSWFGIKREALRYNNGFPATWKNQTPNVPDNFFKNFNILEKAGKRALILENRLLLPSVLFQVDAKQSLAFTWNVRQIMNVDGISRDFAYLFEKELDLSVTQNNHVQNKRLSFVQMAWAEYGLTYARVLKDKNEHFFKAGVTPKLLQGLESMYVIINDLDFLLSNKDTNSFFNMDLSYARSSNLGSGVPAYRSASSPALGLDLGFVYEWRPDYQKFRYKPKGKSTWRKDLNKYKLKFGASVNDLGRIRFNKDGKYYDLDVRVRNQEVIKFMSVRSVSEFDSLLRHDFSNEEQSGRYRISLPASLNMQLDYSVNPLFYVNLSAHIGDLFKKNPYRVHNYSALCIAPRIEHYWFDVSVPFTYNVLSGRRGRYLMTGLNLRMGPLSFGSNDVIPLFKGDVSSFNAYVILRVPIPHKLIKDQDGDGVIDKKDHCPDERGEITLNGCPDKDHDLIIDKEDACPHQPGLAAFKGCPDTDGDGITDGEDQCPAEKGSIALKGCPDSDGDQVVNKDDACPDLAGPKELKGCPDTDKDGIIDKSDLCPTMKGTANYSGCPDSDKDLVHDGIDACPELSGPAENKGCPWPDTDKDGIIDRLDSCVNVPGIAALKGCPEPPKLAPAEKKILEKAFASLEFESGKDIIKASSLPSLKALAKLMIDHRSDWLLKLSGHTDNEGTEEGNLLLSEKRAKAVQAYLVKQNVPGENLLVEWYGQSRPVADNLTKEGRRKNRRVEMLILIRTE